MNKLLALSAAIILAAANAATPVAAKDHGNKGGGQEKSHGQDKSYGQDRSHGRDDGDEGNNHRDHHDNNDRNDNDRWAQNGGHDNGKHLGQHKNHYAQRHYHARNPYNRPDGYTSQRWDIGNRLPSGYYAPNYYVDDYRQYRLQAPPSGYRWVRVDNDVYMVQTRSGLVQDILYGLFH